MTKFEFKRSWALLLVLVLLLGSVMSVSAAKPLKVLTTNFPGYDFIRAIGGGNVDVEMLLPPGAESHSFEPTPKDMIAIQNADLFVTVGGENETWVARIVESFGDKAPKTVRMIEMVDAVPEEIVEGMEHEHDHDHAHDAHEEVHDHDHANDVHEEAHDHDHDHEHNAHEEVHDHDHAHDEHEEVHDHDHEHDVHEEIHDHDHEHDHEIELDEHVWTSPKNAIRIVDALTSVLSELDSENAEIFAVNAAAYTAKLAEVDAAYQAIVDNAVRKVIVVGDRFPLRYLADAYGLTYYAAFSGCSTDTEASAGTIAFLIDVVKSEKIPVVFYIEFSNQKIANAIAEASGVVTREIHSGHNVSKQDFQAGVTLVDLMLRNMDGLKEALN